MSLERNNNNNRRRNNNHGGRGNGGSGGGGGNYRRGGSNNGRRNNGGRNNYGGGNNGAMNLKRALHLKGMYEQKARDALSAGERVEAENFFQHADHYARVVLELQPQVQQYEDDRDDNFSDEQPGDNRSYGNREQRNDRYTDDENEDPVEHIKRNVANALPGFLHQNFTPADAPADVYAEEEGE